MDQVRKIVQEEMARLRAGLEASLATAMRKALDTVMHDNEQRLRGIEEDLAKIMRHLGMEADDERGT